MLEGIKPLLLSSLTLAKQILAAALIPIIEPEIDIQ